MSVAKYWPFGHEMQVLLVFRWKFVTQDMQWFAAVSQPKHGMVQGMQVNPLDENWSEAQTLQVFVPVR